MRVRVRFLRAHFLRVRFCVCVCACVCVRTSLVDFPSVTKWWQPYAIKKLAALALQEGERGIGGGDVSQ